MKELAELYNRVISWNKRAGVKDHTYDTLDYWKAVELQTDLLVEEAEEAQSAAKYGDKIELIDGVADTFVILAKLIDMLEKGGFDVAGAIDAVMSNNDLKIFNSYYLAVEAKEELEAVNDEEYWIETSVENGIPFYTVRKMTGKIAKPVNFPKVSLEKFIPQ
jgi:hypothetical protein